MDTISYLPSPPLSDTTIYMNEDQDQDQENAFEKNTITTTPSDTQKEPTTELKPDPAATPSKKRGRPKATDKVPSQKEQKPDTKEKKQKRQENNNTTSKPKRGRQPGSTASETSFTQEQDAYIRELYTSAEKFSNKDIHTKFEEKFSTGKSSNVIRFRWYKLKEGAIVLSPKEEAALKKAIETIEINKAQAVLNEYGNSGDFTKLSQGFVIKKMKEWAAGGGTTTTQAKEETGDGEDEEEK
ncbi:hypothetical protein TWF106_007063 [Orbilia oligospora]|uniref:Myb-like domain-containing protein n=1 Tax=Orbilia oligospora TaxID=2813651 RepID=A0A6G1MK14_ORBOL|nr:hypothetical protein TWF679_005399 [Orbilia oligospora]KAF3219640.1 hypothetical protein TWF106_007063 [Orbilia oligospora]KAF3230307.1 hypothetical protein TWF191_010193 [Orbilia oligospora]KAF3260576.1 hypothetical protein TWF192_009857 [Orbilia oligospora]